MTAPALSMEITLSEAQLASLADLLAERLRPAVAAPVADPGVEHWLTTAQVAELTGDSEQQVRNMVRNGELPSKRRGRHYRVPKSALKAAL